MPGLFPRVKVWIAREVLTYSDLNTEFDNVIANAEAQWLGGYSDDAAQMQQQIDPGTVGSESLAINISGELERLRFVIARIVGKTYWYEAPASSLQKSFSDVGTLYCPPAITKDPLGSHMANGIYPFRPWFSSSTYGQVEFNTTTTDAKFSALALKNTPFDPFGSPNVQLCSYYFDERLVSNECQTITFWLKGCAPNDTILFNKTLGMKVYITSLGKIAVDQSTVIPAAGTANKSVSTQTGSTTLDYTGWNHILIAYKISNSVTDEISVFVNGTQEINITGPLEVAASVRGGRGMYLLGTQGISVTTLNSYNNSQLPNLSTGAWTAFPGATPTPVAFAGGLLTMLSSVGTTMYYTKKHGGLGSGAWFEMKLRILNEDANAITQESCFSINGDFLGLGLGLHFDIFSGGYRVGTKSGVSAAPGAGNYFYSYSHDFTEWTTITIFVDSDQLCYVYLDNVLSSRTPLDTDGTAADEWSFGRVDPNAYSATVQIERYSYGEGKPYPAANQTVENIVSDLACLSDFITDTATIAALQVSNPRQLFGGKSERKNYPVIKTFECIAQSTAWSTVGTTYLLDSPLFIQSDGRNPVTVIGKLDLLIPATGLLANGGGIFNISMKPIKNYHGLYSVTPTPQGYTNIAGTPDNFSSLGLNITAPCFFTAVANSAAIITANASGALMIPAGIWALDVSFVALYASTATTIAFKRAQVTVLS